MSGEIQDNKGVIQSLHTIECNESKECLEELKQKIISTPKLLNTLQPNINSEMTYPIHAAIYSKHLKCIELLIKNGSPLDIQDPIDKTPLELAITLDNTEIVELLLCNGALINYNFGSKTKYLEIAIEKKSIKMVKLLLKSGAIIDDYYINDNNIKRLKINYESPLINALWDENTEIFKLLLWHGANLECYENDKNSIPHIIIASYVYVMEAIDVMNIYKLYGGNVWTLQPDLMDRTENWETALQSLKRQPCVYKFKGGPFDFDKQLEKLMGEPLSLQNLCRIKIKNVMMNSNSWFKMSELPVPNQIIDFLLYKDL